MSTLGASFDLSETSSDDWARIEQKYLRNHSSPVGPGLLQLSRSADNSNSNLPFDISAQVPNLEGRFGVASDDDFHCMLSPPPRAKATFNAEEPLNEEAHPTLIPISEASHAPRDTDVRVSPRPNEGGASGSSAPYPPPLQEAKDSSGPAAVEQSVRSVPEPKTAGAVSAAHPTAPLPQKDKETSATISSAPLYEEAAPSTNAVATKQRAPLPSAPSPAAVDGPLAMHAGAPAASTNNAHTTRTAPSAVPTVTHECDPKQEPSSSAPSALPPAATTSSRPASTPNINFGLAEPSKPPPSLVRAAPKPPSPSGAQKFAFAPVQPRVAPVPANDNCFVVQADMVAQLRDALQHHFPAAPHEIVGAERDTSAEQPNYGERDDTTCREHPRRERTPPIYLPRSYVEYRPRDLTPSRYDYAHAPPPGSYHQPPYGYAYRDLPPYDYPPPYAFPPHPHMPPDYAYGGAYNREPSPGRPPLRPQYERTSRSPSPAQPRVDSSAPVESSAPVATASNQPPIQTNPPVEQKAPVPVAAVAAVEQSRKIGPTEEPVAQVESLANPVPSTAAHSSGAPMCVAHCREVNYFHAGRLSFHCDLCRQDLHSTEVSRMQGLKEAFREHLSDIEGILPELEAKKQTLMFHKASADQCVDDVKARVAEAERDARGEFEGVIDHLRSVESVKLAVLSEDRQMFLQSIKDINAVNSTVKTGKRAHSKTEIVAFLKRARELRLTCETLLSKPVKNVEVSLDDIKFEVQERTKKLREYTVMRELLEMKNEAIWTTQKDLRGYRKESNDIKQVILHLENYLQMATKALAYKCHYCAITFNAQNANSRCTVIPDYVDHHTYGAHYWIPSSDSNRHSADRPASSHHRLIDRSGSRQNPLQTSCEPIDKPYVDALLRRIAHTVQERGVHIRDAFSAFDFNNDGRVSRPEFFEAMRRLRLNLDDREINAMFRRLDANDDGVVSYDEFINQLHSHRADHRTETDTRELLCTVGRQIRAKGVRVADAFSLFDHNSDGILSREDFTQALKAMQLPVRDSDYDCLLALLDPRKTNQLKIDEFVDRMSQ